MLQSNAIPYGTPRSTSQLWRLNISDVRPGVGEPRLLWHDRVELVRGEYVIFSRRWNGHAETVDRIPLECAGIKSSHMTWRTFAAFDAIAGSKDSWRPVYSSDVQIDLSDLVPGVEVCAPLRALGLPECLDLNPLLEGKLGGKRLLIPALTLLLAVAAPSPSVFQSLMHPLDTKFYALRASDGAVRIRSVGRLRICDYSDRDLACLAYWLQDSQTSANTGLIAAILGHEPLYAPRASGVFKFVIDGYENHDTIVVRRLGQFRYHACWPMDWKEVCLIDECGAVGGKIRVRPGGLRSRIQS